MILPVVAVRVAEPMRQLERLWHLEQLGMAPSARWCRLLGCPSALDERQLLHSRHLPPLPRRRLQRHLERRGAQALQLPLLGCGLRGLGPHRGRRRNQGRRRGTLAWQPAVTRPTFSLARASRHTQKPSQQQQDRTRQPPTCPLSSASLCWYTARLDWAQAAAGRSCATIALTCSMERRTAAICIMSVIMLRQRRHGERAKVTNV